MTKHSIDISNKEQVTTASTGSGKVTGPTWSAGDGYALQRDIERARVIAMEQQAQAELAAKPETKRIAALENEVQLLKAELITMKELIGDK